MKKALTIVVPAYNAEKYLRYNLDSLCQEEILDDLEVIVVNDGSTDSTAEIIEDYKKRYPNTIVPIHKENGGHGSGINAGIRCASGKYFKVIDADDWANAEDLKNLIKYIKEKCLEPVESDGENGESREEIPDIISGGFFWVYGHDDKASCKKEFAEPFKDVDYGRIYSFDEIAEKAYIKMHSMTIRTDILRTNDIKIDEHCYYVDTEYILYPIPYVEKVVFLDNYLYRYSISREGQSMNPKQMMKNKTQYDHVLDSLYGFYDALLEKGCVSQRKLLYIEHLISRVYASRIKILLWDKISPETRKEFVAMEEQLRKEHPGIYRANLNKAIGLFRMSGYLLYYPGALIHQLIK